MERETVVVGEQGEGEICGAARDKPQKTTWLPSGTAATIIATTPPPSSTNSTTNFKQMSKQFQFKLVLLGTHQPRTLRRFLTLALQESPPSASPGAFTLLHPPATLAYLRNSSVSSLVLRFVKDQFDDYRESTIGGEACPSSRTGPSPTNINTPQPHS